MRICDSLKSVASSAWWAFEKKRESIALEQERLRSVWVNPRSLPAEDAQRVLGKAIEREYSLHDLLLRPDVSYANLMSLTGAGIGVADEKVAEQVEIQAKYHGYIERQREEVGNSQQYETLGLPNDLDYREVRGLSIEVQQKLNQHKPETVGQAGRISGITPAAISLLLVHLKRGFRISENTQKIA
jgi:tRNA uridine 5-carboxymethylaminomethyl modification enzyme